MTAFLNVNQIQSNSVATYPIFHKNLAFFLGLKKRFTNLVLIFSIASSTVLAQSNARSKLSKSTIDIFLKSVPEPFVEGDTALTNQYYASWKKLYAKSLDSSSYKHKGNFEKVWDLPIWKYSTSALNHEVDYEVDSALFSKSGQNSLTPLTQLPWLEWEWYQYQGKKERLEKLLPLFVQYADSLNKYYWNKNSKHKLYSFSQNESTVSLSELVISEGTGNVGLSAQVALFHTYVAKIAKELGQMKLAESSKAMASSINASINQWAWNEKRSFYYDIDDEGFDNNIKSLNSCYTLLANTCNAAQKRTLINIIYKNGFVEVESSKAKRNQSASYANQSSFLNYVILRGISSSQSPEKAATWAKNLIINSSKGSSSTKNANLQSNESLSTQLIPIAALIESVIGITVNEQGIQWTITKTDRHGLKNLTINGRKFSFDCKFRLVQDDEAEIIIVAEDQMRMSINIGKRTKVLILKKGVNRFII
jgi:hypothetical protein